MSGEKPSGKQDKTSEKSAFEILFPGTRVEIDTGAAKLAWTVFPVSVRKMQKFSRAVGRALAALGAVQVTKGASQEERMKQILPAMIPVVLEDLLDLVSECCAPDTGNVVEIGVMELPHWHVVPVIEAWITESFVGEGKIRPLVNAVERGMKKLTGKRLDLWETLSKFSSGLDTDSPISSTEDSPASPTEDGASPNSSST